jgi:hypothetical protein
MSPNRHLYSALVTAGLVLSSPSPQLLQPRQSCFEGTSLVCYGVAGSQSQGIDVTDLQYAAHAIRFKGQSADPGTGFWTMPASPRNPGCDEWMLLTTGTVTVLAKHTSNAVNSSVLLEDIATTIDGGPDLQTAQVQKSIMSCAEHGGQLIVQVNTTNAEYSADSYESSGNRPSDNLIKVVKAA